MRKTLWMILFIVFLGAALATSNAAQQQPQDNRYRVAILPFDDGSIKHWWGNDWDVGKGVADELLTELFKMNSFRLVEREQIERIIQEQNFGQKGRVDPKTAAKVGKILGVQYLIMGKVTEFTTDSESSSFNVKGYNLGLQTNTARVAIDARLIDTKTAEIKAAVTGVGEKKQNSLSVGVKYNSMRFGSDEFKKTNLGMALRDAVASVAQQITEQAYRGSKIPGVAPATEGQVADVYGDKVYITIGSNQGVKPGMTFEVQRVVRVVKDPSTGAVIDHITEPIAIITVAEVKERSATCTITTQLSTKLKIAAKDRVVLKKND